MIEAAPDHAAAWFRGELWQAAYPAMGDAGIAWWYTVFSFGPLLLLLGLTVLWLDHRGVKPPSFIAWALAGWVIISTIASGPSPLLLLLIAAALLLIGARQRREVSQSRPADFLHQGSLNRAQSQ